MHTSWHSPSSPSFSPQQRQLRSPQALLTHMPSLHIRLSPFGHSPPSGPSGAQQGQPGSPQAALGAGAGEAGAGEGVASSASTQVPSWQTRLSPCRRAR